VPDETNADVFHGCRMCLWLQKYGIGEMGMQSNESFRIRQMW